MKKKFLALLLAVVMLLTLAACGKEEAPAQTEGEETGETENKPSTSEPDGLVLTEDENLTVKLVSTDEDGFWGYTLNVYIENKTDTVLMVSMDEVSVNGYMCDPFWSAEVAGGKKASSEIVFMEGDLEEIGVDTVTAVTFTLSVSDANDWLAEPVLKQACALYPMGEAAAVWEERESLPTDVVVFNNDYAKMVVIGETSDSVFGYGLQVYLENKTDKTVTFSMEEGTVNEFGCDPFWSAEVAPGMRCISTIGWFESDLADFAITQVNTITGKIIVSDSDDWLADPLYKKTIKINP